MSLTDNDKTIVMRVRKTTTKSLSASINDYATILFVASLVQVFSFELFET